MLTPAGRLSGGISIFIKGAGHDLELAIEKLGVAIKAMKTAVADGLDARTAQSVWRDKAKAGV